MNNVFFENCRTNEKAVGLVELAVISLLLVAILSVFWNLWSREEMRESIYSAASHVMGIEPRHELELPASVVATQKKLVLYSVGGGSAIPVEWGAGQESNSGIDIFPAALINAIQGISNYSASAQDLRCVAKMVYVNLVNGVVNAGGGSLIRDPFSGGSSAGFFYYPPLPPTYSSSLAADVQAAINNFANVKLIGRKLGPITAKYEILPTIAETTEFLTSIPLIGWGCEAKNNLMGRMFGTQSKVVDVFVPFIE